MEEDDKEKFDRIKEKWLKALDDQLDRAGAQRECPICKNQSWTYIGGVHPSGKMIGLGLPFFVESNVQGYFPAVTLSCKKCGFVKQHLIRDEED